MGPTERPSPRKTLSYTFASALNAQPARLVPKTPIVTEKVDLVELEKHPNPMRDLNVDPIPSEHPELRRSIREHGLWGGIVVGEWKQDGHSELVILAGHRRVAAAVAEGIKTAELCVIRNCAPGEAVAVYLSDNMIGRCNDQAAQAGIVAAAIRMIVRDALLSGDQKSLNRWTAKRARMDPVVIDWLAKNTPALGLTKQAVRAEIANLMESGDYHRIIADASKQIGNKAEADGDRPRA
jgi:ParB-like nuclease domain